jgi:hypothetical protein
VCEVVEQELELFVALVLPMHVEEQKNDEDIAPLY